MESLKKNLKWYLLGILILSVFPIWVAVFAEEKEMLTVAFLDVGQGDAILTT